MFLYLAHLVNHNLALKWQKSDDNQNSKFDSHILLSNNLTGADQLLVKFRYIGRCCWVYNYYIQ